VTYDNCAICGERTREGDIAEMYDPKQMPVAPALIVHPDCGKARGLEVA
jgi:hypothetical protein